MKTLRLTLSLVLAFSISALAKNPNPSDLKANFVKGNPEIKAISALTFGPENILFIGDATSAEVMAIDVSEEVSAQSGEVNLSKVDETLAMQMGTTADQIEITDMAVHPETKQIFLSVQHGSGNTMLFKLNGEKFMHVPLTDVMYSKQGLNDAIAKDAEDRRGRPMRKWAISDIQYTDGKIMLTGLSNKEFGSTFRSMPFPFNEDQSYASLEIYHAAHGQYETQAPVKTFIPITLNGKPHVIASYTCTPLVVFPMDELKTGEHTKGKTVAELGNWNTPLDIIELQKDGERYVFMANSSRALMKFKVKDIESFNNYLTTKVEERSGTDGVPFIALPFVNVLQLDKVGDDAFVMLQRTSDGDLVLKSSGGRWL